MHTDKNTQELLDAIAAEIRDSKRIQLIGHTRPDGDCFGSLLGMHYLLEALGIDHRIAASAKSPVSGYTILPNFDLIEDAPVAGYDPDLALFVDTATLERAVTDWKLPRRSVNIDHHASNTEFAKINWIDSARASTAEMVYTLARHMSVDLSPDAANALLLGIMTDTGSFHYSNVGAAQFETSARLVELGADPEFVAQAAYENRDPVSMTVLGEVLATIEYESEGALVSGEVRLAQIERLGGPANVPENLASELRTIRGVRVSILFVEMPEGGLKASFRGDGSVDVARLAHEFGGGGHANASGASHSGKPYADLKRDILDAAVSALAARAGPVAL